MKDTLSALRLDAGNTLLALREPVGETYARFGREYGVAMDTAAIDAGFRAAFKSWEGPRYVGDGRPFWRWVVSRATGCEDAAYFEAVYDWYAQPEAWVLADGALAVFGALREAGVKVAVVSNWDTRLRGLLAGMGVLEAVDAAFISAEVGLEKPDPALYRHACEALGVRPERALHIGDHPALDVAAAREAGCQALLWGEDITRLAEVLGTLRTRRRT